MQPFPQTETKTVCRQLRLEMGYSIGETAQMLGIPKATYQGYDSGDRATPQNIIDDMHYYADVARRFSAALPARVEHYARLQPVFMGEADL